MRLRLTFCKVFPLFPFFLFTSPKQNQSYYYKYWSVFFVNKLYCLLSFCFQSKHVSRRYCFPYEQNINDQVEVSLYWIAQVYYLGAKGWELLKYSLVTKGYVLVLQGKTHNMQFHELPFTWNQYNIHILDIPNSGRLKVFGLQYPL